MATTQPLSPDPGPMSQRFFTACLCVFGGIVVLSLAVDLLKQIWPWLLVAGLAALASFVTARVIRYRRDKW